MDLGLTGQVVLVTGASRGLGAAMALGLAREGAHVIAAARSMESLNELASRGEGRISVESLNLRDEASITALVPNVIEKYGRIDALINNAGIAPAGKFLTQDPEIWRDAMNVNVIAPMLLAQAAGKHMAEQGSGRIVNVASTTGIRGKAYLVAYSTSKGAVVRMTEALAAELAPQGVQVNCIAPGAFVTEAQKAVTESETLLAKRISKIPAGRMADPSEIVPLACLLASPASAFTTGGIFVVDGGESGKL